MSCTYAGIPCLTPRELRSSCQQLGYGTPWAGLANSFTCPQGQDYGRGRVLMFRGDLLSLNLNQPYPLAFTDGTNRVTLRSIYFVRAYCATPGGRGDPTEAYWVELADRRYLCHQPIDRAYNVRSTPGGSYYSATTSSGTAWTWSGMVADLWGAVAKLGAFPGLPFTPNGTPEGWTFYASDAYDSLGKVLERLSCALDYNPVTDTFSIVRLGVSDATATTTLNAVDPACVWDSDPIESVVARVPTKLRVFFPNQRSKQDTTGASPFTYQDATDPTAGGPLPGSDPARIAMLFDDLPAIYDATGTLTNSSALVARAQERAADYFRRMRMSRLYRGYSGGYAFPGLLPGSQLTATIWRDTGYGLFTEVVRLPNSLPGDAFAALAGETPGGGHEPILHTGPIQGPVGGGGPPVYGGPTPILYTPLPVYGGPPVYYSPNPYYLPLTVQNLDNTQIQSPCYILNADNGTSGVGYIKATALGNGAAQLDWMGLQLYKSGTGVVGPQPILEAQDDGGTIGVVATVSNDAADGRVVLKYSWKGLQVIVGGVTYGPERILELVPGPNVTITAVDTGSTVQATFAVRDDDTGTGSGGAVGTNYTGTTTNTYAVVFNHTNTTGFLGAVSLNNPGNQSSLTWRITVTDLQGTQVVSTGQTLSPGATFSWDMQQGLFSGVYAPYQQFEVEVVDGVANNHTTYNVWTVFV